MEEWDGKSFGIATEDSTLRLYIDREDAERYANTIKSILPNGTIMVMKTTQAMAKSLIFEYSRKGFINGVWLCGKTPVRAKVGVEPFVQGVKRNSPSTIMETEVKKPAAVIDTQAAAASAEVSTVSDPVIENHNTHHPMTPPPDGFKLVDDVRKVLQEPSAAERKKIDPSGSFLNIHQLMEKLIYGNEIDPTDMDDQLGLPAGFTKNFLVDITGCNIPKDIVDKYLTCFDLHEFLYVFKGQSLEITKELKDSPMIDPYEIKKATVKADEPFKLVGVRSGRQNGFRLYQLHFKSELREKTITSSTIIDLEKGKDYVLVGIDPPDQGVVSNVSLKNSAGTSLTAMPSKEEEEEVLRKMEEKERTKKTEGRHGGRPSQSMPPQRKRPASDPRMTGKTRYVSETPEEKLERDTQTVLKWIILTKKVGEREARKMMVGFDDDPEVMASFAAYVKEGKSDTRFGRRGYTPRRLMRELHYPPIEAFTMLAELRRKPDDTLQQLKYRETDPQYQPKKNPKGTE